MAADVLALLNELDEAEEEFDDGCNCWVSSRDFVTTPYQPLLLDSNQIELLLARY